MVQKENKVKLAYLLPPLFLPLLPPLLLLLPLPPLLPLLLPLLLRHLLPLNVEVQNGEKWYFSTRQTQVMTALQGLNSQLIQGGHVDELTLVIIVVHLLHLVWVVLNITECVEGH